VLEMPFRDAHHVTGRLVGLAAERGVGLDELTLADMQAVEPRITADVLGVLGVEQSVKSRTSYGGTAPANVRDAARGWLARLQGEAPDGRASEGETGARDAAKLSHP
jgi:argininosuccinate lyase